MKRIVLPLERVDFAEERYRTSTRGPSDKLRLSIRRIGLLHPPFVTRRDGSAVIVGGWKRLLACREMSLSPVEVLDTEEDEPLKNFLLGFLENAATRPIGLVEAAAVLSRLLALGESRETVVHDYMPLLDLPRNGGILRSCLAVAEFTPEIQRGLEERDIPLSVARLLAPFTAEDRAAVFPWILHLGRNKQKELLENLHGICRRDGISAAEVLAREGIRDDLDSARLSPLQKADRLRESVFRMMFPAYSRRREEFERKIGRLGLPGEVGVEPSAFFEKNEVVVSLRVRSPESFRAAVARLGRLAVDPELRKVFPWVD
jgi:hypothetical protein